MNMSLKHILIGAGLAALALGGATSAAAAPTVKVGVIMGLSGPPAIVDFGESYLQGLRLALKDYKASNSETNIDLIVYDDQADPQRAVSLAKRLVHSDRASAVIGTVNSGNVLAFAPTLQRSGIPLIAGPSVATGITARFIDQQPSYIFRCSMVEKYQIDALLDWAVKNFDKIGLLHSTTGYGIFAKKEILAGLEKRDVELVAIEAAAPGVSDVTPQMIKLREAGAELVLHFHESFELPYQVLDRINYHPVFAGNWGLSSLKVEEIVGAEDIEGTVMGHALDLTDPEVQAFNERMRKTYGEAYRWPVVAAFGYDAGQIMFKAINEVGAANPEAIRDAIESIKGVGTVSATPPSPFGPDDHECLSAKDVFLGVWKDGQVVPLK